MSHELDERIVKFLESCGASGATIEDVELATGIDAFHVRTQLYLDCRDLVERNLKTRSVKWRLVGCSERDETTGWSGPASRGL